MTIIVIISNVRGVYPFHSHSLVGTVWLWDTGSKLSVHYTTEWGSEHRSPPFKLTLLYHPNNRSTAWIPHSHFQLFIWWIICLTSRENKWSVVMSEYFLNLCTLVGFCCRVILCSGKQPHPCRFLESLVSPKHFCFFLLPPPSNHTPPCVPQAVLTMCHLLSKINTMCCFDSNKRLTGFDPTLKSDPGITTNCAEASGIHSHENSRRTVRTDGLFLNSFRFYSWRAHHCDKQCTK